MTMSTTNPISLQVSVRITPLNCFQILSPLNPQQVGNFKSF